MISVEFAEAVKELLWGVDRHVLLGFYSFLQSEDQYFSHQQLKAEWETDEDGDPIELVVNCCHSGVSVSFDYQSHEDRMEVEEMMRLIRDWLNDGYGLEDYA